MPRWVIASTTSSPSNPSSSLAEDTAPLPGSSDSLVPESGAPEGSASEQAEESLPPLNEDTTPPVADALNAERHRSNQLEKEIRTLRQQLNRFSEINAEKYARLQEAKRQAKGAIAIVETGLTLINGT